MVSEKKNKSQKKKTKTKKKTCGVKFLRAYLPSCLHEEINSFRLSLENANKRHNTKLGKYIWYLKENLTKFKVTGRILKYAALYDHTSNRWNLCPWVKYFTICKPDLASLNKRNELISSCRHADNYAFKNFTL